MIYDFRGERYEQIIDRHNYVTKHGYSDSEEYSDSDSESDSSLEGRRRLYVSTRRQNY